MDYKEKYEQALEVAQRFYNNSVAITKKGLEDIFPELAESEDEKIRSNLLRGFNSMYANQAVPTFAGEPIKDILAWLEKHKPVEHLELKAGHWYICHRAYCCRADHLTVKEGERFMCEKDGIVKGFVIKEPEKYFKEVCPPAPIEDGQNPTDKVEPKFKVGDRIKTINKVSFIITRIDRWGYWSEDLFICNFDDADKWELVEEPKKCMYTKEEFTEEDRKILCEDCEEECEYAKKEEPVSVWHNASEEPNDMGHCLIFYGCKESVGHYLHYEPVLYNKKEKMFVTSSFPHPTGYKVEQKSSDGGCVAEVYKNRRNRISISDITQWCYLCDLHNLSNVERIGKEWKEEPVSEEQVKESTKTQHVSGTCKENGNSLTQEPVSEIDFEQELYKAFGQIKDFTLGIAIAKRFYDMGRKHNEPVSEELEDAASSFARKDSEGISNPANFYYTVADKARIFKAGAEWQKQKDSMPISEELEDFAKRQADEFAEREYEVDSYDRDYLSKGYYWGCKDGAKWQIAKLMANATEVTVHIDAGGYPYIPQMELYDYDKDAPLAKKGDKYKVVLIKEE